MAALKKTLAFCIRRLLLVALAAAAVWLMYAQAAPPPGSLPQTSRKFQQNDDLLQYINFLFDATDADPDAYTAAADDAVKTLWRRPQSDDEKLAYFQLLTNFAYHFLQSGQVAASTRWYEAALQFYRQQTKTALIAEMEAAEYLFKPLGNNYTRMGDFGKAVQIQERAIELAKTGGNTDVLPGLYNNLATTFFWMQDYPRVQQLTDAALASGGHRTPAVLLLYSLKAEAYLESGLLPKAIYWNNKALQHLRNLPADNAAAATVYTDRAAILLAQKQYSKALEFLQAAWQQPVPTRQKAKIANSLGQAYERLQNKRKSGYWYTTALRFFTTTNEGLFPDFTVTNALFGKARSLQAIWPDSAAHYFEKAVLNDYYTQQLITASLHSKSSLYANEQSTAEAIAFMHGLYDSTRQEKYLQKALWLTELSKGRKFMYEQQRTQKWQQDTLTGKNKAIFEALRNDYLLLAQAADTIQKASIQKRIRRTEYALNLTENRFAQRLQAPSYTAFLQWLQKERQQNTCISYFVTPDAIYSITADKSGFSHRQITRQQADPLKHQTQDFLQQFFRSAAGYNNHPERFVQQAAALLQAWLPGYPFRANGLLISADDFLHQLPFEALCSHPAKPVFVGVEKATAYSYSFLQNVFEHTGSGKPVPVDLFQLQQPHEGFSALPHAGAEGKYLRRHFLTTVYAADTSSETLFIGALQSGHVIHFASHAVASDGTGEPILLLKNRLFLGQLQYITARCPLLVLAACETGAGALQQREGTQSLGRAFLSKGVQGVLSTRWEADDATAAEIMKLFYQFLPSNPSPAAALLRARQTYLQKHPGEAAQNPWLWANFYYQGKNVPLNLTPAKNNRAFLVSGIAGLLLAGLMVLLRNKQRKRL